MVERHGSQAVSQLVVWCLELRVEMAFERAMKVRRREMSARILAMVLEEDGRE